MRLGCFRPGADYRPYILICRLFALPNVPTRRRAHRRGRCLSSKQPDTQGENGSATAPMISRGLRSRMALSVRPNRPRRVNAATNKPYREGNFHKTSRKLIADRFSVWQYSQRMEKKVV
jgi:hypothetical protein